jgi:hypothetical protein
MEQRAHGLSRVTVVFLVLAALCTVVQFALSFVVRVVARPREGVVVSSSGGHSHVSVGLVSPPTKTYFEAFGLSEIILTAVGIGAVVLVGYLLHRQRLKGRPGAGSAAWTVSIAAALLGFMGFAYLWGLAICLMLACVTMHTGRSRSHTSTPPPVVAGAR